MKLKNKKLQPEGRKNSDKDTDNPFVKKQTYLNVTTKELTEDYNFGT